MQAQSRKHYALRKSLSAADRAASSPITWRRNPRAAGADALKARMRVQGGETLTRMLQTPPDSVGIGVA